MDSTWIQEAEEKDLQRIEISVSKGASIHETQDHIRGSTEVYEAIVTPS